MKRLFFISTIFTLFVFGQSVVPSYIKICGRRDPDFDGCVKKSVEAVREKLKDGIPELDIPSIDPFLLPEGVALTDLQDISASTRNIKLWNLSKFELKSLHVDLKNQKIDFSVFFKQIKLLGDYDFQAKIVVPLSGSGPVEIEAENVDGKGSLMFQLRNTKSGSRMYFTTIKLKLEIGDYHSNYIGGDGPSAPLNEAINAVFNGNRQEILARFIPALEKAISGKLLELANKVCRKFTIDELFPDRE